ncbi:AAA family ATPase [Azonexus sp.]|jgi:DNA transposition AAA+ family ATPase|uniref:AAA family ATPase n=1 Tax=Azonexus sp. TaxID=1872668 RepID=UPI0027B98781|nr:AAA family ATPase [Azonexus sp.]
MKDLFVKTSNYVAFEAGINKALSRGAMEATNVLVYGPPGTGKTENIDYWAVQNDAIHLRANEGWTPRQFMKELATKAGIDSSGSAQALFERLLSFMVGTGTPLVVDEVNFCLAENAAVMEKIRDFSDRTETLVIYAGDERVIPKIGRHAQIASRFAAVVEFKMASLADVRLLCDELAEVQIADDLASYLHQQSGGRVRNIIDGIAVAERIGKKTSGRVGLADCEGMEMMFDWQTRRSAVVKAVRKAGQ